ncbi:ankyrin repeat-containing domain protein [Xylaria sp. FL0933]|nr:ankyrin repeat-containing domain protein [Xylaria sp. FL0933]
MEQARASAQVAVQTAHSNFQATSSELTTIRNSMNHQQSMINSDMQAIQDAVSIQRVEAASHKQEVNNQLSTIHNSIHTGSQAITSRIQAEQTRQFKATQAVQMAILNELATLSNVSMARRQTGRPPAPAPTHNNIGSVVFFSLRLPGSRCEQGCECRCHLPARAAMSLQIPPMLRAAFGDLFLGYTGYPSHPASCNVQSCARGKHMRIQAIYSFPLWLCLHYVVHACVEASTSGIFTFALAARRRMPFQPGTILYETQFGTAETVGRFLRRAKGCIHDVYAVDGRPVLTLALNDKNPDSIRIIKLLLQNGADPDQERDSGLSFRTEVTLAIFSRRHPPDYSRALQDLLPFSLSTETVEWTYMHKIVLGLLPISLADALQKPAVDQVNAKDRFGRTPLMYAASHGNVAAVRALIDAGANVDEVDIYGQTALHGVVLSEPAEGDLGCVDALLLAGADADALNSNGRSTLYMTADRMAVDIGRRLIEAGADVQLRNPFTGETPLARAAYFNVVGLVRPLCDAGVSLEPMDRYGDTPLFVALEGNSTDAFVLLLRLGANTAHINNAKRTLLHQAANFASLETMRALTNIGVRGQDATAREKDGLTAQELLEKRQPTSEMKAAFAHLLQVWCASDGSDDGESDDENYFHDAVEYF